MCLNCAANGIAICAPKPLLDTKLGAPLPGRQWPCKDLGLQSLILLSALAPGGVAASGLHAPRTEPLCPATEWMHLPLGHCQIFVLSLLALATVALSSLQTSWPLQVMSGRLESFSCVRANDLVMSR